MENNNVITIDSKAFHLLVDRLVSYVKEKHSIQQDEWITADEAMRLLNITSSTTLMHLRSGGRIEYSQPMHKVILYKRTSILNYIESHSRKTF